MLTNDQILSLANNENPLAMVLLVTLVEKGRILISEDLAAQLAPPETLPWEKLSRVTPLMELEAMTERDLLIAQGDIADLLLWARHSRAQIVSIEGLKKKEPALCDYMGTLEQLQEAFELAVAYRPQLQGDLKFPGALQKKFSQPGLVARPALFLDRDGVVIEFVDFIHKPEDVRLKSGIVELIQKAQADNRAVVIVTNQSGIGRERFFWQDYQAVNDRMLELLAEIRLHPDMILVSPYYEKSMKAYGLARKSRRKPRGGMFLTAAVELNLSINESIMVGDTATDIMAAAVLGLKSAFLVGNQGFEQRFEEEWEKWRGWSLKSYFPGSTNVKKVDHLRAIDI